MKPTIEKRYFTITEVSKELDVKPSMLRYWEKEFRQLNPRTNSRGKRYYTRKDIELIVEIHRLVKEQRFTIDGARKVLDRGAAVQAAAETSAPASQQASAATGLPAREIDEVAKRLEALKAQLMSLKGASASAVAHNPESLTQAW